jgi:hypothetical protein
MSDSMYRGEVKPRRQGTRHHIETSASAHMAQDVSDPFPPISNKQFPAFYVHDPVKQQYRRYMRAKTPMRSRS